MVCGIQNGGGSGGVVYYAIVQTIALQYTAQTMQQVGGSNKRMLCLHIRLEVKEHLVMVMAPTGGRRVGASRVRLRLDVSSSCRRMCSGL